MFKIYGPPPGKGLGCWIFPLWKSVENENVENSRQWKERDMEGNMVLRMKKVRPGAQLPVSYTHLDVYNRQAFPSPNGWAMPG